MLQTHPQLLNDVLPPEYSARTSVHRYGRGAFACQYSGHLIFSDGHTNGVYTLNAQTKQVECVIPGDEQVFFADFDAHGDILQERVLAVPEHHHLAQVVNSIVAIDLKTKIVHMVKSGVYFYAHLKFKVGTSQQAKICWTEWNHLNML